MLSNGSFIYLFVHGHFMYEYPSLFLVGGYHTILRICSYIRKCEAFGRVLCEVFDSLFVRNFVCRVLAFVPFFSDFLPKFLLIKVKEKKCNFSVKPE